MTAAAVDALAAQRDPRLSSEPVRRMLKRTEVLLHGSRNRDGGWGQHTGDSSDVISTAYGLIATCGQEDPAPAADAAAFLLAARRGDGGLKHTDLLTLVGRPVAFEPSPALSGHAVQHGWPQADRTTLPCLLAAVGA
ncbi:hypothetical protein ACFPM3_05540 [Streptomyces coeruleoprunus]|uniref:Uncharacterized protein n=1 Tax=Streptomyces coeruleoprunus TaxID=285563 RepID=A0ABV9X830_9ACTN